MFSVASLKQSNRVRTLAILIIGILTIVCPASSTAHDSLDAHYYSLDTEVGSDHIITVYPIRIDYKNMAYPQQFQFRRKGQADWYGKTFYKFDVFNRTWTIEVEPIFHQTHFNYTKSKETFLHSRCYYKGRVLSDKSSTVRISLCEGMKGDIHLLHEDYVIYPLLNTQSEKKSLSHHLSLLHTHFPNPDRRWRPLLADNLHFCEVQETPSMQRNLQSKEDEERADEDHLLNESNSSGCARKKRSESPQEHYLEILVVADSKMAAYHGKNLHHYILTLMSTVAVIYKDPSIGNNINLAVVDIAVLNETEDREIIHHIAPISLRKFCQWQHKHNKGNDADPTHYDTAILITREDICRFPGAGCDTLGLAQSGMACNSESSCAVIEDNGLSASFTIAHELGHVLGIPHDDDSKCSKFYSYKHSKELHVMARMLDFNSNPWTWSECSRQFLTTFLEGYGRCLMDRPSRNRLLNEDEFEKPPGQLYHHDRQCQFVYGMKSRICPYMPACKRLWCTMDDTTEGGCRTQHMPWADGTQCGNSKRCHQGECVRHHSAELTPIDGQWGKWMPFGTCSRTCGGGIKKAFRECDSPKPSTGGKFCTGVRLKYRSCNIRQDCPDDKPDFRTQQCASFNFKKIDLPGVPSNKIWVPKYTGIPPYDNCKLYCKVNDSSLYFVLREKVTDGTPCQIGSFDKCVNGKCEVAGCDHILYSKMRLDECGVCGGSNNTCTEIKGHFSKKVAYGYHDVVMIPPGASNVRVLESSLDGVTDENFIALKDPLEKYLLNGDFMISMFPKTLVYHGMLIDYSGSNSVIEHINCSGPLRKLLIVEVLVVGKLHPPNISFSYIVPHSSTNQYSWKLTMKYSECSRLCNGMTSLLPVCVRVSDQYPVDEDHCTNISKPSLQKSRKCNVNCVLKWQKGSKSECSVDCGRGLQHRVIKCIKEEMSTNTIHLHSVPEEHCFHLGPKPSAFEKCWGYCLNSTWRYSDWSECSVTCGKGVLQRKAKCINMENSREPDRHCDPSKRKKTKLCNQGHCPEWEVGNWTKCSSHCGNGTTRRSVYCFSSTVGKVEAKFCSSVTRPAATRECFSNLHCLKKKTKRKKNRMRNHLKVLKSPFGTPRDINSIVNHATWKIGEWSKCSSLCGEGVRRRKVTCHDSLDSSRLSLIFCRDSKEKPNTIEKCNGLECSQWDIGKWSECPKICGIYEQYRHVLCKRGKQIVDDNNCLEPKPSLDKRLCKIPTNCTYKWKKGFWSQCSASCGPTFKTRQVICIDQENRRLEELFCSSQKKPNTKRRCKLKSCPYM